MDVLDTFSLKDRVAVITGGAGLYGRQLVLALARAGARVYMASRNMAANEKMASELRENGLSVFARQVDLSLEKSILSLCDEVYGENEKIDILVNNAVLRTMDGYSDTAESFEQSMRVNATGLFIISRAFGDKMAAAGKGSIINIGSYMGILGPDYTLYEGTDMNSRGALPDYFYHKGGITNYTRFLAGHYGKNGVRCNCLELGGFFAGQQEKFVDAYCKKTMLGRMANDTDVAGALVFLASDASAYITGAIIPVDGGYSAK